MKGSEKTTVTLLPGNVLSVTTDATGSATITREADSVGGGQPQSTQILGVSSVASFGPYQVAARFSIQARGGNVDYAQTAPSVGLMSAQMYAVSLTPGAVGAANATGAEQTFAVAGVVAADKVAGVSGPAAANACVICSARVVGAGQIAVSYSNPTAGALTPAAGVYNFVVVR